MSSQDKCISVIALCLALGACTLIGGGYFYNLKTNQLYANLIKGSQDPLAVRCAWNGDQQVCNIVGLAHR